MEMLFITVVQLVKTAIRQNAELIAANVWSARILGESEYIMSRKRSARCLTIFVNHAMRLQLIMGQMEIARFVQIKDQRIFTIKTEIE